MFYMKKQTKSYITKRYTEFDVEKIINDSGAVDLTTEEKDIVSAALRSQNEMMVYRSPQLTKWEQDMNRSGTDVDTDAKAKAKSEGRAYIRLPLERSFIESKTADEIATVPFPVIVGDSFEEREINDGFTDLMNYVVEREVQFNKLLPDLYMKQKNPLGDGFLMFKWIDIEYEVQVLTGKTNKDGTYKYKKEKVKERKIQANILDNRNLLLDPIVYKLGKRMVDIGKAGTFEYFTEDSFHKYFNKETGYKNTKGIKASNIRMNDAYRMNSETEYGDDYVEIYTEHDIIKDKMVVLANNILIKECPYPYRTRSNKKYIPITRFIDHIATNGFFGEGEPRLISHIVEEKEAHRAIDIDVAKYSMPMIVASEYSDIDEHSFKWRAGGMIRVQTPKEDITTLNSIGTNGLPFRIEGQLDEDMIILSQHDIRSIIGEKYESATQTLTKKESGLKGTRLTTTVNEYNGFEDSYWIIKNMILQFYKQSDLTSRIGRDGKSLWKKIGENMKALQQDYSIYIVPNNQIPASRELQKKMNIDRLGVINQVPIDNDGNIPEHSKPFLKALLTDMETPEEQLEFLKNEFQGEQQDTNPELTGIKGRMQQLGISPDKQQQGTFNRGGQSPASTGAGAAAQAQSNNVTQ